MGYYRKNKISLLIEYKRKNVILVAELVCEFPGNPRNGEVSGEFPAKYGDVASFTCADGFALIGESQLVCRGDNTWSDPKPECKCAYTLGVLV